MTYNHLHINLDSVVKNYYICKQQVLGQVGVAVKADSYGLGAVAISKILSQAGCQHFFVATLEEGIELRQKSLINNEKIFVLYGVLPKTEAEFHHYNLIPVINSLEQLFTWNAYGQVLGTHLDCTIHVDTGMNRLGMPKAEFETLLQNFSDYKALNFNLLMSHLACADEVSSHQNLKQLEVFKDLANKFKQLSNNSILSLANSSGIFLSPTYHFDLARPGMAIYGLNPCPGQLNPMVNVASLYSSLLQIKEISDSNLIGYGASYKAKKGDIVGTISIGYADGMLRSMSNKGYVFYKNYKCPIIGRVSMDLINIDLNSVPHDLIQTNALVEIFGENITIDEVANNAGTISYEIITSLGSRLKREYQMPEAATISDANNTESITQKNSLTI